MHLDANMLAPEEIADCRQQDLVEIELAEFRLADTGRAREFGEHISELSDGEVATLEANHRKARFLELFKIGAVTIGEALDKLCQLLARELSILGWNGASASSRNHDRGEELSEFFLRYAGQSDRPLNFPFDVVLAHFHPRSVALRHQEFESDLAVAGGVGVRLHLLCLSVYFTS